MTTMTDANNPPVPERIAKSPSHWRNRKHADHFRNHDEEFDASKFGMWLFLTTEVLLFAGIFVAYAVFRMMYPEAWANGSNHLDWVYGGANTVVLLISSWTAASAVRCAQINNQKWLKINLIITILCAGLFLFIKFKYEYMVKLGDGKAPGTFFSYPNASDAHEQLWWSLYYMGTGLHALHVVIGAGLLCWVLVRSIKYQAYGPTEYTMVENTALYWHIVDLIWIFLFPLLYLVH
ncbi:MAG: cytochrome c oxidase subunit 3 family protein [Phycisphaerales bacterium]|nr:cytochrome c oxidase subunit 3 family protein [Phycisphaerales bacterium]